MNVVEEEKATDFLSQIDEFRKRAEALEDQMQVREEKVTRLQSIVEEKQQKVVDLDAQIVEQTKQADAVQKVVKKEIEAVAGQFTMQMNELQDALNAALEQSRSKQEASMQELSQEVSQKLGTLENATNAIPDRVHSESVQVFRNTRELVRELDTHVAEVKEVAEKTKKKSGVNVAILVICIVNLLGGAVAALFLSGAYKFLLNLFF